MEPNELKTEEEIKNYRAQAASEIWGTTVKPVELPPEQPAEEPSGKPEAGAEPEKKEDTPPPQETDDKPEEDDQSGDAPALSQVLKSIQDLSYRISQAEKRVGSVQNAIQNPPKKETPAETPTKEEIRAAVLDDEKWQSMVDEYPEFEGPLNLIKESIVNIVNKTGPAVDEKIGAINKVIDTRFADHDRAIEIKFIARAHPDWQEVKDSKEFNDWLNNQPLEFQDTARKTGDALEVIRILDTYKGTRSTDSTSQPAPDHQTVAAQRKERLDRSVTPQIRGKTQKTKAVEDMTDEEYRQYKAAQWDKI